jgi:hypothetical protein
MISTNLAPAIDHNRSVKNLPESCRSIPHWGRRLTSLTPLQSDKPLAEFAELFNARFMTAHSAYHQLGRFIVAFQQLEAAVNDVLELTSGDDCGVTRILVNNLEYSKRLNTESGANRGLSF